MLPHALPAPSLAASAVSAVPAPTVAAAPAAPVPISDPTAASSTVESPPDDDETDIASEAADQARQERGLYERAADGSIVLRRLPAIVPSLAAATAVTPAGGSAGAGASAIPTPVDLAEVGFPARRWTCSGQVGRGQLTVLCVAEKPSIALALANLLSDRLHTTRAGRATPVHEFDGMLRGQRVRYRVTSVAGHVQGTDFEAACEDWAVDPATLFHAQVLKVAERGAVLAHLADEARGCDALLLWLDCDREGENICFEVMEVAVPHLNEPRAPFAHAHPPQRVSFPQSEQLAARAAIPGNVLRARFSALTAADVARALDTLSAPNELEARAVDARQELDLRIGVAFTRFQTRFLLSRYDIDGARTISYGPCQIPTLGLCASRHDEIQRFQPETYWQLQVKVRPSTDAAPDTALTAPAAAGGSENNESLITLQWERGPRIFSKEVGAMFHHTVAAHSHAAVTSVGSVERRRARPVPLNTVELLKVCSRSLAIGPTETMRAAERLYMDGWISYPRTETSAYHPSFDVREAVAEQGAHPLWGEFAQALLDGGGLGRPNRKGVDAGDHPPITPLRAATQSQLGGGDCWRVYEYVSRHFLASVAEDALYEDLSAALVVGDSECFTARSSRLLRAGFLGVMPWLLPKEGETDAPLGFAVGQRVRLASVDLLERVTAPPGYLTESELIGLMEQHGIGTDASIPVHIRSIMTRGYVTLGPGRTLRPSALGSVLVHAYQRIDPALVAPSMRSAVEKELDAIATGRAPYREVVQHVLDIFARKFAFFVANISQLDELFSVHFRPIGTGAGAAAAQAQADPLMRERLLSQCGKCRKFMTLHPLPAPPRLHCPVCDEVHLLPSGGQLKKFMARSCPLDQFELLLFTTAGFGNQHGVSYALCPYCYNNPPFGNDGDPAAAPNPSPFMTCAQCTHPTCRQSLRANAVSKCPEWRQCGGMLVLDPTGGPHWKLNCNRCNVVLNFARSAHKVLLDDRSCGRCQARLLEINFHKDHNPLQSDDAHSTDAMQTGDGRWESHRRSAHVISCSCTLPV